MNPRHDYKQRLRKTVKTLPYSQILLYGIPIFLVLFGLLEIFNASLYKAFELKGDYFYFLKLQFAWVIFGLILAAPFFFMPVKFWKKIAPIMLLASVILLIAVFIFGEEVNGSFRWISLGPLNIQPAEFVKPVLVIYLSVWLTKEKKWAGKFSKENYQEHLKKELLPFLVILGLVSLLVVLEPDLGTTMILVLVSIIMYLLSRDDMQHIIDAGLIFILGVIFLLFAVLIQPYRLDRIETYYNFLQTGQVESQYDEGYQLQQIMIGIGSGGIFGKGLGQSRQRFGYLVEATAFTDSIFAVIAEELGWLGSFILLLLFFLLFFQMSKLAFSTQDAFSRFLVTGISFWIVIQALLHMAANLALIPVTGIPLPYITYGGSSMSSVFIGTALVWAVARNAAKKPKRKASRSFVSSYRVRK